MTEIEVLLSPVTIMRSDFVTDYYSMERSWRERLFTRPWKPLEKWKPVHKYAVYYIDDAILVSPRTYNKLLTDPDFKLSDLYSPFIFP